MSFYNWYIRLLENNEYVTNYTLVFIKINNEDLQHWSYLTSHKLLFQGVKVFVFDILVNKNL